METQKTGFAYYYRFGKNKKTISQYDREGACFHGLASQAINEIIELLGCQETILANHKHHIKIEDITIEQKQKIRRVLLFYMNQGLEKFTQEVNNIEREEKKTIGHLGIELDELITIYDQFTIYLFRLEDANINTKKCYRYLEFKGY